ncbi:GNAT family N-acetyltransferase [Microbacterium marinilacus]|uniref:N-acetyltransferase domain-containing protein n=1 Tax=Microbacterium marinilacus TaxID=415209 RepID=A0ABP7B779_9MICO|nr:GNAT family N-acetyltransferase [Microbacterium marinilacus]MBY0687399.1 GNAT family N-acetyltransferase [Microbacterium marinilacus]
MADSDVLADVTDDPARDRYEARLVRPGHVPELVGVLAYQDAPDGARVLLHTVVGEEHGGHGVGAALAAHAVADARRRGVRVVPVCTFVQGWLARHPEHADIVA